MKLEELARSLKHRLALPLPGKMAQFRMAHAERRLNILRYHIPEDAKQGSVLALLYEDQGRIKFPLILRPDYSGVHSGQVSFPGGKPEAGDDSLLQTALRESEEEIGILSGDVKPIGRLTELYIPPSNFLVHPHVGYLTYTPVFIADPTEVVKVLEVQLDDIMDPERIVEKEIKLSTGKSIVTPCFELEGETVWGATAMILSELGTVLTELGY
jgi:8-oxo-dGTP pyrophosphatase MutT (NUDIX family)